MSKTILSPEKTDLHRPAKLGAHLVPGIWRHMLPYELRSLNFPREKLATCDNCPKVESDGYRPDYRCCTYYPRVPNFLLGLALADTQANQLLHTPGIQAFLTPEGFQPSPHLWATFVTESEEDRFGKTEHVLCPFLLKDSGHCGIYAFRNSVCSTFFCEFEYGGQGRRFWDRMQTVAMQVELALSQWSLTEAGFDVPAYIDRLNELAPRLAKTSDDGRTWSAATRRFIWGDWYGRELELYAACADAVARRQDDLWEIADSTDIVDAVAYEKALNLLVPEKYREALAAQADDHESDIFETAPPSRLWKQVVKQHRKMWKSAKVKSAKGFFNDGL